MKELKKEIVDNDEILKIVNVNERNILITNDMYENDSIKGFKKGYPDKNFELDEALINYMGENDLKNLKQEFPDEWKHITKKLGYPYEFFNCIEDYQKPVDDLKKEDFFSKLKTKCPDDEEIERTKQIIKLFIIKNGDELSQIYLKGDVLLLTCVVEKFIKVSVYEFGINSLYCVSLSGYI